MIKQIFTELKQKIRQCAEYFCIGFTNFMLKIKSLLDYTNSFSSNGY